MKLLTYDSGNGPRAGVLSGDNVVDAASLLGESRPLRDVQALLELPNDPLNRLRLGFSMSAEAGVPLSSVKLRSPVLQPPTVRDFMVYEGHASGGGTRQLSDAWYRLPIFYFSNTLRIFGPEEDVEFPSATNNLDYELEIGVVIGKEGRNVKEADWLQYVAGFTIFNDWSCRDLQRDEMAAGLGPAKGKDSATSLGPYVVTPDELTIRDGKLFANCILKVNGEKLFFEKGAPTRRIWYYQLDPGRNLGKTNPLNDDDLADFVALQGTFADSPKSWSVDVADIDKATYDLSVKNPNVAEAVAQRTPAEILDEIAALDSESAGILDGIRALL